MKDKGTYIAYLTTADRYEKRMHTTPSALKLYRDIASCVHTKNATEIFKVYEFCYNEEDCFGFMVDDSLYVHEIGIFVKASETTNMNLTSVVVYAMDVQASCMFDENEIDELEQKYSESVIDDLARERLAEGYLQEALEEEVKQGRLQPDDIIDAIC